MEKNIELTKLVLFDGNAILHRAFHAYPQSLQTQSGELTNAVYGFTTTLLSVFKKIKPTHAIVAFDEKAPTFRHKKFDGYKASRPKMDDALVGQISRTREVVHTLNIPHFGIEGFEADDVLGTLARQAEEKGVKSIIIVTGDKDALQLLTDKVIVMFPSRGKISEQIITKKSFIEKYGFMPELMIDFKALAGDASDEIPGVSGIGPKTATELICKYGQVEEIYNHLSEINESVRIKLINNKDSAYLSKELATIHKNVPILLDEEHSCLTNYDKNKAISLFIIENY